MKRLRCKEHGGRHLNLIFFVTFMKIAEHRRGLR